MPLHGLLPADSLQFFTDFETRVQSASSRFAQRFDDPEQCTHRDLLTVIATRDPETIQRTMRRHLATHRNPPDGQAGNCALGVGIVEVVLVYEDGPVPSPDFTAAPLNSSAGSYTHILSGR